MTFKVSVENNCSHFLFFEPRLDYLFLKKIESDLLVRIKESKEIIFDLSNVIFFGSAFIRICLEAIKAVGKSNFKIANAHGMTEKLLSVSHMKEFTI